MSSRKHSFFFRHILISSLATWALLAIATLAAAPIAVRLALFKPDLNGHQIKSIAEVLQASLDGRTPEAVVSSMASSSGAEERSGDLFIADEKGQLLARSYGARPDFNIDPGLLPRAPFQVATLGLEPPSPGEPAVVLLRGQPLRYLIFQPVKRAGPEQFMMVSILGFVTIVIFLAMGLSSFVLLRKLRGHASQVGAIMDRLQRGDLTARLTVERDDEFGELMTQFNSMANDVERLFNRVRESEAARIHLLQDIGHDLRTPLSSLLSLFEILKNKFDELPDSEKKAFLLTGRREIKFTQRLVDDLLFLARVEDPSCTKQEDALDLASLIEEELEAKRLVTSVRITSRLAISPVAGARVTADAQLLRRLVRNAIDNSISFAHQSVEVTVEAEVSGATGLASAAGSPGEKGLLGAADARNFRIQLHFDDDGPGFSPEALGTFGRKRPTRIQHASDGNRISLGLGSVIIAAIARLYSGAAVPSNRFKGAELAGGRISVTLFVTKPHADALKSA